MPLFDFLKNAFRPSPPARDTASVAVEGELLTLVRQGHTTRLPLDQLQSVSGWAYRKGISGLALTAAGRMIFVPMHAEGFAALLRFLIVRWQVDERQLNRLQTECGDLQWLIWQRFSAQNAFVEAAVDAEQLRKNLWTGFYLRTETGRQVPWDTPFDRLLQQPFAQPLPEGAASPLALRFTVPALLGNVAVEGLSINHPFLRKDVPPAHYQGRLLFEGAGDANYFTARDAWTALFGPPADSSETAQRLQSSWQWEGLELSLYFDYDSAATASTGAAVFLINNRRGYPAYWHDEAYENGFRLSRTLYLDQPCEMRMDWRNNPFARPTPEGIQRSAIFPERPFLIWLDEPAQRIGFANAIHAVIIPGAHFRGLECRVTEPDKGPAQEALRALVRWQDAEFWVTVAEGHPGDFERWRTEIGTFLGCDVGITTAE